MPRLSLVGWAVGVIALASPLAAKKFVPPPMPIGYGDPGPEPTDALSQIAADLKATLKDPYSVQQFSMCGSRVVPAFPPYSPTSAWERAERIIYFLLNAKNSYGGFVGVAQGTASFVDGKLTGLHLTSIADQHDEDQQKMADARGVCHPVPDADIQRLMHGG